MRAHLQTQSQRENYPT